MRNLGIALITLIAWGLVGCGNKYQDRIDSLRINAAHVKAWDVPYLLDSLRTMWDARTDPGDSLLSGGELRAMLGHLFSSSAPRQADSSHLEKATGLRGRLTVRDSPRDTEIPLSLPYVLPPVLSVLLQDDFNYAVDLAYMNVPGIDSLRAIKLMGERSVQYTTKNALDADTLALRLRLAWARLDNYRTLAQLAYPDRIGLRGDIRRTDVRQRIDAFLSRSAGSDSSRYLWMQQQLPFTLFWDGRLEVRAHHYVDEDPQQHRVIYRQELLLIPLLTST
ncbi:MAG: hypothetical protein WAU70_17725 [Flavobacteriales bacterium]